MQSVTGPPYVKRSVPEPGGDLSKWPLKLAAFLGIELGNLQRGLARASGRTVTASTTATVSDGLIVVDATSRDVSVTLPAPGDVIDSVITIKRIDASAHTVTIVGTIDGVASPTLAQWKSKTVWAYAPAGTAGTWYLVASV